jgi:spore coat polysaccharide biosynthesis protein SpsF
MNMPHVVVVCQARMGSTRLPGKVMLPLAGAPLLQRFVERVSRAKYAHAVVVATTMRTEDGAIVKMCDAHGWNWYRGHTTDLLDRTYHAAVTHDADIVVKVPSDCPLIDPDIIDLVVERFLERYPNVEYTSNLHPATWPDGNDVEVMSINALRKAFVTAKAPHEREHTTPWLWDGNNSVQCSNVINPNGKDLSMSHRWTIDYHDDYKLIRSVYDALYPENPEFSFADIVDHIEQHPEVAMTNAHLCGVNWYRHHLDVLQTIHPSETRFWTGETSSSSEAA